ncbi:MAG: hypothetical protein WC975_16105 [Phycisphaerae bacterium]
MTKRDRKRNLREFQTRRQNQCENKVKKSSVKVIPGFKITFEENHQPPAIGPGPIAKKFTTSLNLMVDKFKRRLPTPEQIRKSQKLGDGEEINWDKTKAKVRFFSTSGGWTWYAVAFDGVYFYGKIINPIFNTEEYEAFRIYDLENMRFNLWGVPDRNGCFGVEYATGFKPEPITDCH